MAKYFLGAFQAAFFYPDLTLGNPNFSRTVAGITKWFEVTIEGMLRYLLSKFEDLVPTSLGSGAI